MKHCDFCENEVSPPIDGIESRRLEASHNNGIIVAKIEAENTWLNEYCPSPSKSSRMLMVLAAGFICSVIWPQNLGISLFLAIICLFVFWSNELDRMTAVRNALNLFRRIEPEKYYRVFPRRKV